MADDPGEARGGKPKVTTPAPAGGGGQQDAGQADGGNGGGDGGNGGADDGKLVDLTNAESASPGVKIAALVVLLGGLVYCLVVAGRLGFSHNAPFQTAANFALFAAFIVVAGAIERFIEPLNAILPPFGTTPQAKGDKALIAASVALLCGIAISSAFGLYFLETMGVKIGAQVGTGIDAHWVFTSTGDKWLRGLDIFLTALLITGGTKPLHDMISSIEKKKDSTAG
jgi:hypothetical protein